MAIDHDKAANSLSEIAKVESRTRQAVYDWVASDFLIMWGLLTAAGFVVEYVAPRYAWFDWGAVTGVGILGSVALYRRQARRARRAPREWQMSYAMLAVLGFGLLLMVYYGDPTPRQISAYWPTLFMMGYVVAGLWVGRFFIVCGLTVAALILAGYFWAGDWFYLWMALVHGGGLVAGGLYLRRVGVPL